MQAPGSGPGFGPRPPYHPGMQQGGWQQQQPVHQQGSFQRPFLPPQNGFPQQYAVVSLNANSGMMPGPQQQGFNQMAVPAGFGMGGPTFVNSFNAPPFAGPPGGGRGMGPRPPPGQPPVGAGGERVGVRGRGPGRGATPGRGGRGPSQGRGRAFAGPRAGPAPPSSGMSNGMSKDQRKNAKAMAKLDKQVQEEKPRVYKPLGEEESLEAARWQAERRKHYPTAANISLKAEAASQRSARGELEPETALRQKRLQEVLIRQRELGLQQIAGTADMPIHGQPNGHMPAAFPARGRGGRGGRFGRAGGRGGGFGRGPGRAFDRGPALKRPFDGETPDGQQADKRQKSANEAAGDGQSGGLASLAQYGSDDDDDADAAPSNGIDVSQGAADGQPELRGPQTGAGRGPPQTPEEKQALYLKHKAQIERQQQQHQDKMERRKKAQEQWQERRGRGRGRGRGVAGRGQGGRHPDRSAATQQVQRKPTLLQKLLVKDIRRDHSHILQCFRFFVNNNFLQDVGSKPVVYPDPPPTLRQALPPVQDEDDSLASDSEDDSAAPNVNGQEQVTESSGDSEEVTGDDDEDNED